jgi:GNAT superfamily N-acetyltransferase
MSVAERERSPVHALLERVHEGADLAAEYPLVFGPDARGVTLAIADEGDVRAGCALLVREFHTGKHRVRGGLIGSVGTAQEWRGRGLGTRLVLEAERVLRERGCIFALLWADRPDFYLQRGWAPFGEELDVHVPAVLADALPDPIGVRAARSGDADALHALYERHAARVERTRVEMRALLAVPGMRTLVRERDGAPVAYAALGRGRDLANAIHEWAGTADDVLALVRAHLEERSAAGGDGLYLMAPPMESALAERLSALGATSVRGILGLGKVLRPRDAAELLEAELGLPGCATVLDDGRLVLSGPSAGADLDPDALQALLFGAAEVRDEARKLLARLGLDPAGLPLQPFAWGLDSI